MTTSTALTTCDISPRIGTEIRADKADLLSGYHAGALRELLEQRGVLVFPQIGFTDDEQIAFTETLGTLATERKGEKVYNVTLDTSADRDSNLTVTVDPLDLTVSDAESGHVSFVIGGVDADNASVVLTVSDMNGNTASADAGIVGGVWVASVNVGELTDQSFLASSVTVTDTAGNVATAAAEGAIFLDMSADADNDLGIEMIGTGEGPAYDGPVGFEVEGVDLNDVVNLNIGLAGPDGSASVTLSVDPDELGMAGLGLLGRGIDAADTLSGLVAILDASPGGSEGTDASLGLIEADLGIEAGEAGDLLEGDAGFRRAIDGIEGRLQGVIGGEAMGRLQGPDRSLPIALSKGAEEALTKALPRSLVALRRGGQNNPGNSLEQRR